MTTRSIQTRTYFVQSQPSLVTRLLEALVTWQERAHQRHALQQLNGRDLRDLGLSRADISSEANKPFWRA